jgi:hypothetical protein
MLKLLSLSALAQGVSALNAARSPNNNNGGGDENGPGRSVDKPNAFKPNTSPTNVVRAPGHALTTPRNWFPGAEVYPGEVVTPVYRVTTTLEEQKAFEEAGTHKNDQGVLIGKFIVSEENTLEDVVGYAATDYLQIHPAFLIEHRNAYKRDESGVYTPACPTLAEVKARKPTLKERGPYWPLADEIGVYIVYPIKPFRDAAAKGEVIFATEQYRKQLALGETFPVTERVVTSDAFFTASEGTGELHEEGKEVSSAPAEDLFDTTTLNILSLNQAAQLHGVSGAHILNHLNIDVSMLQELPEELRSEVIEGELFDIDWEALKFSGKRRDAEENFGIGVVFDGILTENSIEMQGKCYQILNFEV